MHVVLWDTRRRDVAKDFAGGFGVGQYHGSPRFSGRVIRHFFRRDHRPAALSFAYLAAIFRRRGHRVEYCLDRVPTGAEVYVFNPALATLDLERQAIVTVLKQQPQPVVLVVGAVARWLPEVFAGLPVTIVDGEAEQLHWKLDEVLAAKTGRVNVGQVTDLDALPQPDWEPLGPRRFRIGFDFWKFPSAYIEQSRGCTLKCDYCPYIAGGVGVRFREPAAVVDEMRQGIAKFGFRSFKFRDPLFGLDRPRTLELAERIGRLNWPVQFSIESRIDLLHRETLRALARAGLTSVTIGIERPDAQLLRKHSRVPIADDRQREFIELCRELGVRTVAGFMLGFPDDTRQRIHDVWRYARWLNPTFANFNLVTPYPGTPFYAQIRDQIASFDFSRYDVYTPVLKYEHLSADDVSRLHARAFAKFYFRRQWLSENATLVWPQLRSPFARITAGFRRQATQEMAGRRHASKSTNGLRNTDHLSYPQS